ncbi:hypothetical protein [Cellulomonas sp.]|uniref:hypothetical protein n=1 Tax=Cellulomonas sp. TaxID=40001 RepID=UPI003BAC8026
MTAPLRDLLGQLADHEDRSAASTAPDLRTETLQMRSEIRRRRAGRLVAVTTAAAAVVAVGLVTANAFTAPPALQPAVPEPSPTVTASPTPAPSTPAPSPSTVTPPAVLPQAADLTHGNAVWGAYVAVVDSFESPAALAAKARITELGYESSGGEIGCDQGAAEALGLPEGSLVVATYLATQADALLFVEMYGPGALGVAEVTLFCLD